MRRSRHGYFKNRACQTCPGSLFDQVANPFALVGGAADVGFLGFRKAFNHVAQGSCIGRLGKRGISLPVGR